MKAIASFRKAVFWISGTLLNLFPFVVHALLSPSETGLDTTASRAGLRTTGGFNIQEFVGSAVNAVLGIIGVVFLVLIVYGGMLWMLSEGDETKVGKARGLIFHSIIGLILVLSAYAITNFVVSAVIKQTVQP